MPLLISFEIWHGASRHRRDKVKKKSCLKYGTELAAELRAGQERGERRKGERGAAARAIGLVCSPGSLCVLFLQRALGLYRGQTLVGRWAWSEAWAKKQEGCCQVSPPPLACLRSSLSRFSRSRTFLSGMISSTPRQGWQASSSRSRSAAGRCRCVSTL